MELFKLFDARLEQLGNATKPGTVALAVSSEAEDLSAAKLAYACFCKSATIAPTDLPALVDKPREDAVSKLTAMWN